jgi:two-component system cell cycle response regulator
MLPLCSKRPRHAAANQSIAEDPCAQVTPRVRSDRHASLRLQAAGNARRPPAEMPRMDETARHFSVAVIGFSEIERKVLQGIFRLSEQRPLRYSNVAVDDGATADILLVDGDDQRAVAAWRAVSGLSPAVTVVAGQTAVGVKSPTLSRPLQWGRLLKVLDTIVTAHRLAGDGPARPAILVADRAPSARIFLKQKFAQMACTVDFADDARNALAMLEGSRYLAIFVDVAIGGGDAYQLCKQVTATRSEGDVRVVMLSDAGLPYNRLRGAMSGCDGYLAKPIDEVRLEQIIERYFPDLLSLQASPPASSQT